MQKKELNEKETAQRRDEALRRALQTLPKPHKQKVRRGAEPLRSKPKRSLKEGCPTGKERLPPD